MKSGHLDFKSGHLGSRQASIYPPGAGRNRPLARATKPPFGDAALTWCGLPAGLESNTASRSAGATEMKQSADDPGRFLWSVISLFVGGWIALECVAALGDLRHTGAFVLPKWLTGGGGWQFDPMVLDYASSRV
jgi:hypothetical protein